jgi:hypothetical protein
VSANLHRKASWCAVRFGPMHMLAPQLGSANKHGLSAGAEKQIVEQPWIALTERVQLVLMNGTACR